MYVNITVEIDGSSIQSFTMKTKSSESVCLLITSEDDVEELLYYLNELYEDDIFDNENDVTPYIIAEIVSEILNVESSQVLVIIEPVEVHNGQIS